MSTQKHTKNEQVTIELTESARSTGVLPPMFDRAYIAGAVEPFLLSTEFTGETPMLPMIDLALSKDKAAPAHLWGMLYENWIPNLEKEGRSVFITDYESRGPDNARKRIYMSATTPDLVETKYRPKIARFYERFLADANAGKPMMQNYFENYFDL